mmetsp:Transcript_8332/g.17317  ORF Transcript_8332/g.17317 Transcript_8332/m.17317 type:complete len:232 (+) Transcript_8332:439-1134(+)
MLCDEVVELSDTETALYHHPHVDEEKVQQAHNIPNVMLDPTDDKDVEARKQENRPDEVDGKVRFTPQHKGAPVHTNDVTTHCPGQNVLPVRRIDVNEAVRVLEGIPESVISGVEKLAAGRPLLGRYNSALLLPPLLLFVVVLILRRLHLLEELLDGHSWLNEHSTQNVVRALSPKVVTYDDYPPFSWGEDRKEEVHEEVSAKGQLCPAPLAKGAKAVQAADNRRHETEEEA